MCFFIRVATKPAHSYLSTLSDCIYPVILQLLASISNQRATQIIIIRVFEYFLHGIITLLSPYISFSKLRLCPGRASKVESLICHFSRRIFRRRNDSTLDWLTQISKGFDDNNYNNNCRATFGQVTLYFSTSCLWAFVKPVFFLLAPSMAW